jgi:integrase
MHGTLTEWCGTGSRKRRLRVLTGRDEFGKAKSISRNFKGSRSERPTRTSAVARDTAAVHKLVRAAEERDTTLATAIALAAITRARRGELCALRWSDVNWTRNVLRIARSLIVIERELTEGPTKTHARRDLAVDEALRLLLEHRRATQETLARTTGVSLTPDPYILSRSADGSTPACRTD